MILEYPMLAERVYTCTARCGLPIRVLLRPGFSRKVAYFATDFGSIHRDFRLDGREYHVPAGTAHFLEHKMFELPGRDVSGEFAALGANVNAFTSYDMTAYYFSCCDHFGENLRLLLEFVSTPCFPAESVRREMGIIDQEIGMNEDVPESRVFDDLMRQIYTVHPIREPILGSRESIRQLTPASLECCHRAFYTPENMILCVAGDVDPAQVTALVDEVLLTCRRPAGEKLRRWQEPMAAVTALRRQKMEVPMPTFQMACKCEPTGTGEAAIRREIVGDLAAEALFGEASALYLALYSQGKIDGSFGGGFDSVDGCAMLTCGGDSWEPEAVRDAVLSAAAEIARDGLPEADFLRMKRSAMGRRVRELDSFDSTCVRICAYYFGGYDYLDFPRIYTQVTQAEIQEFLRRVVTPERCALSVIDPLDTEEDMQ
ncbi:MAG: insulinase family protein [Firmicutes bacterium]|nr:insulinase family protein [Bacillota bacterium]